MNLSTSQKRFLTFGWILLAYTIAVILWGAFVRATGSGAGCGAHWPTCQGDIIHRPQSIETFIELTHRLMSAVFGFIVLGMIIWAFRIYPKGHLVRKGMAWSLFFTITESLLGAGLVLFELVAYNVSAARAFAAALHLTNTFLLVGAITLTVWWAGGGRPLHFKGRMASLLGTGLVAMIILSAAGAITALGDTIFQSESLMHGILQDLDPTSHFLIRLRVWHPVIAIVTSLYLVFVTGLILEAHPADQQIRRFAKFTRLIIGVQLVGGVINILLLAPVWMQMVHLLLADLLWIGLILLTASTLAVDEEVTVPATAVVTPTTD